MQTYLLPFTDHVGLRAIWLLW